MSTSYDMYNREERYQCAHPFRLLHEPAWDSIGLAVGNCRAAPEGFKGQ